MDHLLQDLPVREITNGAWAILPVCMAVMFWRHVGHYIRTRGWTRDVEVANWFAVFLCAFAAGRASVWFLFLGIPFPAYSWVSIALLTAGEASGARLIFLLTNGMHRPWIASVAISVGTPALIFGMRFLLGR